MNIPSGTLDSIALVFWWSLAASALAAWPVYRLLLLTKSRQTVSQHAPSTHMKKQGTPTMGGIVLLVAFVVATLVSAVSTSTPIPTSTLAIFLGFAAIGFIDDFVVPRYVAGKRGLGWKQKFLMQAVVAGVGIYFHSGHVLDLRWGVITFVVMFMANAYNFADGLDALAGSILLFFGAGLLALSLTGMIVPESALIAACLMGAVVPFLFLNAPPAKVFMGDVGSLPVGAVLGVALTSILSPRSEAFATNAGLSLQEIWERSLQVEGVHWRPEMALPLLILCVLMVIELVPVPMQIFWVKVFKRRIFPFTPIHHAFEKAGWPETRVVWSFALSQVILSALAFWLAINTISSPTPPASAMHRVEARR